MLMFDLGLYCILEGPSGDNAKFLFVYLMPVVLRDLLIWCV